MFNLLLNFLCYGLSVACFIFGKTMVFTIFAISSFKTKS